MTKRESNKIKRFKVDRPSTGLMIRSYITASEYSVTKIARMLGIDSEQSIYKWMRGDSLPTIDNLLTLARILGVRHTELLVIEEVEEEMY